jgi:hypothetical protein
MEFGMPPGTPTAVMPTNQSAFDTSIKAWKLAV